MTARRVKLILEAQVEAFKRGMDRASQAAEGVKSSTQDIGKEWSNASRTMQADMSTVGKGYAALGGSILAVYGGLVKTGIEYNTLQQVAGRALETVMGSASAAADQMERLHEFADTSPFARQTWIQAQMQLVGFGMEAERVVPTLEAIQNAVAAIGGGDAEIMRLVDILGSVEGQGRITGRELQRLGQMGIDAAALIGESMGVSGEEIRTQITAGALDAETAITALTDGMMTRFDGAAEGLRTTLPGAFDRLKAAWRDLGSILATPLVDPDGGGGLVWLVNTAADLLRELQRLPDPVLQSMGAIAGLSGAAMAAYGAMYLLVPRIVAFREAKQKLAQQMPRTNAAMRGFNIALAGLSVGLMAASAYDSWWESVRPDPRSIEEVERALQSFSRNGLRSGPIVDYGAALNGMDEAGNKVLSNIPHWAASLSSIFSPNVRIGAEQAKNLATELENTDTALAGMASQGHFESVATNVQQLAAEFIEADRPLSKMRTDFPELTKALEASGISMDELLVAVGASKGVYDEASGTYKNTSITLEELADRFSAAEKEALGLSESSAELDEALAEVGVAADGTVESLETFLDVLYRAGLLTQSVMEADIAFEAQLRSVDDTVQQLTDSIAEEYEAKGKSEEAAKALAEEQMKLGHALDDSQTKFDHTTDAGQAAAEAFLGVADRGRDLTQALADNDATQEEVQAELQRTYDSLVKTAEGFGMTKDDAEALTGEILGIPPEATVESWMSEEALDVARRTKDAILDVDGLRTSSSHTHTIHQNTVRSMADRGLDPTFHNVPMATGGAVIGPGGPTDDLVPIMGSNGEHMLTARDVRALGGQQAVYQMRRDLHAPSPANMVSAYQPGQARQAQQFAEAFRAGGAGGGGLSIGEIKAYGGDTQQVVNRVGDEIFRRLRQEGFSVGQF